MAGGAICPAPIHEHGRRQNSYAASQADGQDARAKAIGGDRPKWYGKLRETRPIDAGLNQTVVSL
jgi:hypothetical protein